MFLDQIEHICDRRIQMENLQTLDNSVLAEVVGGKIVAYPYGVYYNTKTGKAQIDPAGFAATWGNNVVSNGATPSIGWKGYLGGRRH